MIHLIIESRAVLHPPLVSLAIVCIFESILHIVCNLSIQYSMSGIWDKTHMVLVFINCVSFIGILVLIFAYLFLSPCVADMFF